MSLIFHHNHHVHDFFKQKELNELYISHGIMNFALGLVSVFVPVYLYTLGYSIVAILGYFFLNSLSFVLLSYVGARAVAWLGVKHSMLTSVVFLILYFIGLRQIEAYPWLFFILPIARTMEMMLYNYSFHLNFISHADRKDHGKDVTFDQTIALLAGLAAPFVGGLLAKFFGFNVLFFVGLSIIAVSVIPLFFSAESYAKLAFNKKGLYKDLWSREGRPLLFSYSGYAIESWIGLILWPIFLMIILTDTSKVGALISLPAFITLIFFYFFGKKIDQLNKNKLLSIGSILHFFGWVGRLFVQGFDSVFLVDAYKRLSERFVQIPWSAIFYDIASDGNYFKMIVQREVALNVARMIIAPVLMVAFTLDKPNNFLAAFIIAALASLLYPAISKFLSPAKETSI
ncbi:MAG: Major facilitator superfamily [Parcubacteria group bacterium GW2011_GWE2_39_37]|uniref:Major facilitator superfamily n=1 Tax=Candidatus Falkowbacteria bacterium GW2011_GWF2_39_8 TaxID=1618642 RepID=A0A0G0Q508_9BACT|nr:MAG: Major facilitator superfamily [Parcubacteria group bacterium GW2011_GWE2_39_37]KKR32456.1 MAG: Major facilitator superfamily [Candidatus Falkowbacteria bacterium GW2011_GWF2_39_8]